MQAATAAGDDTSATTAAAAAASSAAAAGVEAQPVPALPAVEGALDEEVPAEMVVSADSSAAAAPTLVGSAAATCPFAL